MSVDGNDAEAETTLGEILDKVPKNGSGSSSGKGKGSSSKTKSKKQKKAQEANEKKEKQKAKKWEKKQNKLADDQAAAGGKNGKQLANMAL